MSACPGYGKGQASDGWGGDGGKEGMTRVNARVNLAATGGLYV